jgi:nucleoside-diphosphate-sugar epimerase
MKVLVFGAAGYIGSAVVDALRAAGHSPVAAVHDPRHATADGLPTRVVDLNDTAKVRAAVSYDIDAVLHVASPTGDWAADRAAVDVILDRLRGTGKPFVYTSGVWVLGATGPEGVDESAPTSPLDIVSGRPEIERAVLSAATDAVATTVIRPGIVHGWGGGITSMMVGWARERGVGVYVGDEPPVWPMVHVDDLADLYLLAITKAEPGALLHGVAEPAVSVSELARAADRVAGGPGRAVPWPVDDAAGALGTPFATALAASQTVRAAASRELGWFPRRAGAVADLAASWQRVDLAAG